MRDWFRSGSIGRQIAALAICPVVLLAFIAIVILRLAPEVYEHTSYAEATAVRIQTIVEQVQASGSPAQVAAILDAVNKTGMRVDLVSAAELHGPPQAGSADGDVRELVRDILPAALEPVLRGRTQDGVLSNFIVVRAVGDTALAFAPAPTVPDSLINKQVHFVLKALIAILPVMLTSFYAGCLITRPLTRFADTAQALEPDEGPERPFEEGGSLEMRKLATSLNDMRSRIRGMLNDRTSMLRAISHDLRTPLTRLRLRAEKSSQPELRAGMLNDIKRIDEMLEETLAFLSKDASTEEPVNADLPSLLQTICADFGDIGFAATYEGPDRSAYPCKPRALARAVSNLVDNGTKFADVVVVRLVVHTTGAVQINVIDDGPGVAEELHRKVLEPFFKVSTARTVTEHAGFGLGLSIVNDIVRGHGGSMRLINGPLGGLIVSVDLPAPGRDASRGGVGVKPKAIASGSQWRLARNNS